MLNALSLPFGVWMGDGCLSWLGFLFLFFYSLVPFSIGRNDWLLWVQWIEEAGMENECGGRNGEKHGRE